MAWEEAMYSLVNGLMGLIFNQSLLAIAIPVLTLTFLLWFLRWSFATARGANAEDMSEDISSTVAGYDNLSRRARGEYGPDRPMSDRPYRAPWNRRRR